MEKESGHNKLGTGCENSGKISFKLGIILQYDATSTGTSTGWKSQPHICLLTQRHGTTCKYVKK